MSTPGNPSSAPPQAGGGTFGKYRILERVAVGGMAEIYKARLDGIGGFQRTFAIKRILPHLSVKSEFVDMLVEEAKIAGLLNHANIVQILDLGQVSGAYYIAMEFVDGPDLGRILRRCREKNISLPVPHAAFIAIEMLKGLEYAHNRQVMRGGKVLPLNIVHRDISPANVLVSFEGGVKLTDFGIARASIKALETVSGVIKGRFNYMSPEQASAGAIDQRSDLFNVGVVLYEMLTGVHPFTRRSEPETIEAIREGRFTLPSAINPDIPDPLEAVITTALQPTPEGRFASATAMKDALDRFFHDSGFIFTHSTLSSFLRGLFPTEPRGAAPTPATPAPEPPTSNTSPLQPEQTEDGPTNVEVIDLPTGRAPPAGDTTIRRRPDVQFVDLDTSRTPHAALAGMGEESTFIRPNPLGPDDAASWSNAETAIKADPLKQSTQVMQRPAQATNRFSAPTAIHARKQAPKRPPPAPPSPAPAALGEATQPARPPLEPMPMPAPAPSQGQQATVINSRTFRRFQVLYLAFGAAITILVLLVGMLLGGMMERSRAAPLAAAVEPPPAPPTEAQVEVHLPAGSKVTLDGRQLTGAPPYKRSLPPGVHRLKVEGSGHEPIETEITLVAGDLRVLRFEIQPLPASKPKK